VSLCKKQHGDHIFLLSLSEKPTRFWRSAEAYESMISKQEESTKRILSYYGHRCEVLGLPFTMLGGGVSSLGKKICLATKQFNIHTVAMGKQGLGALKTGLGSVVSYVAENCDNASVFIMKLNADPNSLEVEQDKLTNAINNEKLLDLAVVYDKSVSGETAEPKIVYDGPTFLEFVFRDIDEVMREFKLSQEELRGNLEKDREVLGGEKKLEQPHIPSESKLEDEKGKPKKKMSWPGQQKKSSKRLEATTDTKGIDQVEQKIDAESPREQPHTDIPVKVAEEREVAPETKASV